MVDVLSGQCRQLRSKRIDRWLYDGAHAGDCEYPVELLIEYRHEGTNQSGENLPLRVRHLAEHSADLVDLRGRLSQFWQRRLR